MGYVVACMVVGFFFGGISLLIQGVWRLVRRWTARDRMVRTRGKIVRVDREHRRERSSRMRRNAGADYENYPVIEFRIPGKQSVEFRSETSDRGTPSRFIVGQRIEILYDPEGDVSPLINTWSGVWSGPIVMMLASVVFIGCAIVISSLFRERILASTLLGSVYDVIQNSMGREH